MDKGVKKNTLWQGMLPVYSNERISGDNCLLVLDASEWKRFSFSPGQFISLKLPENTPQILRRPFSILDYRDGRIFIAYKVVGQGTALISSVGQGAALHCIGPLGNGIKDSLLQYETIICAAGGIGIAPVYSLLKSSGCLNTGNIFLFYGARSKEDLILLNELKTFALQDLVICTDDGSAGAHGLVTIPLEKHIPALSQTSNCAVFSCGPNPMLKAVKALCSQNSIPCFLSLEAHMGCGTGACLCCVVRSNDPASAYLRVCKDGPVFAADQVVL